MKKIKLYPLSKRDAARQEAQKILDEVRGKLKHSVELIEIFKAIACTRSELDTLHCPLKEAKGVKIVIDGTEHKSKRYKYSYEAVQVTIVRDHRGWCIEKICRIIAYPGNANERKVYFPKDLISSIAERLQTKLLSY